MKEGHWKAMKEMFGWSWKWSEENGC